MVNNVAQARYSSYGFDFDSNLLFTKSLIHLLQKNGDQWQDVAVTQEAFDGIHVDGKLYKYVDDNPARSMREFREEGKYIEALTDALTNKKFGPGWERFIHANVQAEIIGELTARGQSPEELRSGHKMIIMDWMKQEQREQLIKNMIKKVPSFRGADQEKIINYYLDKNLYLPLSSHAFLAQFPEAQYMYMAEKKYVGFSYFVQHVQKTLGEYYPQFVGGTTRFSVGFSDDNVANISSLEKYIESTLINAFPYTKFVLYDTSNPSYVKKIILTSQESGLD